jgi:hypothetical protein
MPDKFIERMEEQGYSDVRKLPDGTYAGLIRLLYSVGLCTRMDEVGYSRRFCFNSLGEAKAALSDLEAWDGEPEPGSYIARRPEL